MCINLKVINIFPEIINTFFVRKGMIFNRKFEVTGIK